MRKILMATLLASATLTADSVAAAVEQAPVGDETRAWTALQLDDKAASQVERPMPGEIAERIYERYATSFSHPIPEKLSQDSFSASSGSGSGGK